MPRACTADQRLANTETLAKQLHVALELDRNGSGADTEAPRDTAGTRHAPATPIPAAPKRSASKAASATAPVDVATLVEQLGLVPHPEGGFYRETFRDARPGATDASASAHGAAAVRGASTAILYLLRRGDKSKIHRLDASEVWHAYMGGPITIVELRGTGAATTILGHDLAAGQVLQHVVPPGTWFGAAPCDGTGFALVGCTVAPAFDFGTFEMGDRAVLLTEYPDAAPWIERLMAD